MPEPEMNWKAAGQIFCAVLIAFLLLFLFGKYSEAEAANRCELAVQIDDVRGRPAKGVRATLPGLLCTDGFFALPCDELTDGDGAVSFTIDESNLLGIDGDWEGELRINIGDDFLNTSEDYVVSCKTENNIAFPLLAHFGTLRLIERNLRARATARVVFIHGLRITQPKRCLYNGGEQTWGAGFELGYYAGFSTYEIQYVTKKKLKKSGKQVCRALKWFAIQDSTPIGLVGHSAGGLVLRSALQQCPEIAEYIASVVTLGTPHDGVRRLCRAFACRPGDLNPKKRFLRELNATPLPEGPEYLFVGGRASEIVPITQRCDDPAVSDGIVTIASATDIASRTPNAKSAVIEGLGHTALSIMTLRTQEPAKTVLEHLNEVYCADARELCFNGVDDNCNGEIDEGCTIGEF